MTATAASIAISAKISAMASRSMARAWLLSLSFTKMPPGFCHTPHYPVSRRDPKSFRLACAGTGANSACQDDLLTCPLQIGMTGLDAGAVAIDAGMTFSVDCARRRPKRGFRCGKSSTHAMQCSSGARILISGPNQALLYEWMSDDGVCPRPPRPCRAALLPGLPLYYEPSFRDNQW